MPPRKIPTFSLSVIKLLAERVYYRTLARIQKIRSGGNSPETSEAHSSPANKLPLEVVEIIVAYLVDDNRSLRACTMTGRSWYIAAVPHLHRTLTVSNRSSYRKDRWPNSIMHMYMLGLLPLVKEFRFYGSAFSPKLFSHSILRKFSALTNVQDLEIQNLEIPKFMPKIQRYFRNFSPTVRSLILKSPQGSCRQVIYFIGLFEHLQDLEISYHSSDPLGGPADDPTLIPAFVPPLQGRLGMKRIHGASLLKDMVDLFGGLRFDFIHLYDVEGMSLLLEACAETLEVVILNSDDPRAESSLRDFDLSRDASLRRLKVHANLISSSSQGPASRFLKHVLSTITSPVFSEVIIYCDIPDSGGVESYNTPQAPPGGLSQAERVQEVVRHRRSFEVLREMRGVRDFQLVLEVWFMGFVGEETVRIFKEAVAEEKAEGGFNDFLPEAWVDYQPYPAIEKFFV